MTHTSGLTPGSLAGGWGGNLEGDLRLWLMVGVTQPSKPFSYANSGMVLLQLLAARIQYGPALYVLADKLTLSGAWLASCWNFTARNFRLFLDRLRNNDLFASSALTTDFINNEYGCDPTSASYLTKGGLLPSGDGQFESRAYIFPDGTVAFVVINSNSAIGTAVPDAYDAANPDPRRRPRECPADHLAESPKVPDTEAPAQRGIAHR